MGMFDEYFMDLHQNAEGLEWKEIHSCPELMECIQ